MVRVIHEFDESKGIGPDDQRKNPPIGQGDPRDSRTPDLVRGRLHPPSTSRGKSDANIVKSNQGPTWPTVADLMAVEAQSTGGEHDERIFRRTRKRT